MSIADYAAQYGFVTAAGVAKMLGVKRESVYRMRMTAGFPQPEEYVGRTPLWRAADVRYWRQSHPARARRAPGS